MFCYYFKPRLWPTLTTVAILVSLLMLGNWQVERLEWKLGLIEQIESRAFIDPVALPFNISNLDNMEYLSVSVTGSFNNEQEMTLYSVGPNGEPGYDLYTPFVEAHEKVIIVNRGWVPEQMKNQADRPETLHSGELTLEGLLRKPSEKLWYGPENEPDNNNWYYGDINAMAKAQNLNAVYPMYLYAAIGGNAAEYPVAGRTEFNIVNNHLDYALTWYGLAIVLLIVYFVAHTKKKQQE
jgi:surfeit locus 1 family protein